MCHHAGSTVFSEEFQVSESFSSPFSGDLIITLVVIEHVYYTTIRRSVLYVPPPLLVHRFFLSFFLVSDLRSYVHCLTVLYVSFCASDRCYRVTYKFLTQRSLVHTS